MNKKELFKVKIIIIILILLVGGYFLLKPSNKEIKTYDCNDVKEQVNSCWEKKQPTENSTIDCWEALEGYKNTCENFTNEDSNKYVKNNYWQCDRLSIIYFPPSMAVYYNGSSYAPNGLVSFSCPLM